MCQVSTCVGFHVSSKKHEAQRKCSRRLNVSTQQCYSVTTTVLRVLGRGCDCDFVYHECLTLPSAQPPPVPGSARRFEAAQTLRTFCTHLTPIVLKFVAGGFHMCKQLAQLAQPAQLLMPRVITRLPAQHRRLGLHRETLRGVCSCCPLHFRPFARYEHSGWCQ